MKICFVVADEDIPINLNLFLQGDVEDPDPSGSKPFWPDPDSVTKLNHNKVFNSWYQKSFINIVIKGQTLILKYVIGRITDYTLLYTYTVPSWIRIRSGRSRSASLVQIPHFHIIFRNKFFARAHTHTLHSAHTPCVRLARGRYSPIIHGVHCKICVIVKGAKSGPACCMIEHMQKWTPFPTFKIITLSIHTPFPRLLLCTYTKS